HVIVQIKAQRSEVAQYVDQIALRASLLKVLLCGSVGMNGLSRFRGAGKRKPLFVVGYAQTFLVSERLCDCDSDVIELKSPFSANLTVSRCGPLHQRFPEARSQQIAVFIEQRPDFRCLVLAEPMNLIEKRLFINDRLRIL